MECADTILIEVTFLHLYRLKFSDRVVILHIHSTLKITTHSKVTRSPHFECRLITYVGFDFIRVSSFPSSVRLNAFAAVDRVAAVLAELDVDLEVDHRGWKAKAEMSQVPF